MRHDNVPRSLDDFIAYFNKRLDSLERARRASIDDSRVAPVAPVDLVTSYTAVLSDKHRLVRISNASATTFTIPPNATTAFLLGTSLQVAQQGTGKITITAGAGVILRVPHGARTAGQYSIAQAIKVGTDEWYVTGDTIT